MRKDKPNQVNKGGWKPSPTSHYDPCRGHSGGPGDAYDDGYFVKEHKQELNARSLNKRRRDNNATPDEDLLERLRKEDENAAGPRSTRESRINPLNGWATWTWHMPGDCKRRDFPTRDSPPQNRGLPQHSLLVESDFIELTRCFNHTSTMADLFNGVDNDGKTCAVWTARVWEFRGVSMGRDTLVDVNKNFGGSWVSLPTINIFLGQVRPTAPF